MSRQPGYWRRLWIIPPVAIGVALLMWQVRDRQEPERITSAESVKQVRIVEAIRGDFTPMAEGYGPVRPARVWKAVAQVSGRVVAMDEDLGNGSLVTADTELLRIDPVDYELALARIEAELTELEVRVENTRASLDIEERSLALSEREYERIRQLVARGTTSQSESDSAERVLLGARTQVRNLQNTLALLPAQRSVLEARRAQALRDIENTVIRAPFDMRVAALSAETDQYVTAGQSLLEGDSVARVEVVAQVSMASLRTLILDREEIQLTPEMMAGPLADLSGFRPVIELDLGNYVARWDARFVRVSDVVDAETRTIGLVVAVDDPIGLAIPGKRPPLSKGMFVKVVIYGDPLADRVVVPRHAIRGGKVVLADEDDRLRLREVAIAFEQQDVAIIENGLEGGERVVVTDVIPLVEGMLLGPVVDEELSARLRSRIGSTQ
jgi:RND family efflux transporter MFP subunit